MASRSARSGATAPVRGTRSIAEAKKPLWAPEIHYIKGTFWLTYSMPGWDGTAKTSGSGLLKSTTGKPEGPYDDVQPDERLGDEIDASLFEDDDGAVYFLWHCGKIARMKPDMSGLAEPYRWLKTTDADPNPKHHSELCAGIFGKDSFDHVGYEGMFLFKAGGRYYLCCCRTIRRPLQLHGGDVDEHLRSLRPTLRSHPARWAQHVLPKRPRKVVVNLLRTAMGPAGLHSSCRVHKGRPTSSRKTLAPADSQTGKADT